MTDITDRRLDDLQSLSSINQYNEFERDISECLIELRQARERIAELEKQGEWISVDDELPESSLVVDWWLIPKPPKECMCNTSGEPICPTSSKPLLFTCRYKCWSSLYKPTHWRLRPSPPKD